MLPAFISGLLDRGHGTVVTDWTVALFFRRDIAQLGTLGHPERVGDG